MKKILHYMGLASLLLLLTMPLAEAADSNIGTMAGIVMQLNHYPSAGEQKQLAAIAGNATSTAGEKVLANALMRMRHHVSADDAVLLRRLDNGATASSQEKELAEIVLGIMHHASSADKKRLKTLLD
ncbi:MAG: hypothetical protein Q9M14_09020 [Mariprofundaceae bacterium]|nr:hypothetical protein [Mariprofundaceae bacterium]